MIFFPKLAFQPSPLLSIFVAVNKQLWEASRDGDIDSMKAALADGAQVEHREDFGYGSSTCLHVAVRYGRLDATKLLLEEEANIDAATGKDQWTPMMMASQQNEPEIVKLLMVHNGKTNLKDSFGQTALHHAAYWASSSVVQLLVEKSNVNARDNEGKTPLSKAEERMWGKKEDQDAVIEYLKENGATV